LEESRVKRYFCLILTAFLCVYNPSVLLGGSISSFPSSLDLEQCLSIAKTHHPDIKKALAEINVADSQVEQVLSQERPGLDFSSSYSRQDASGTQRDHAYSSNLNLSQLISDSGKTALKKKVAQIGREGSEQKARTTEEQVVYDVKNAYFDALEAQKKLDVAEETLRLYTLLREQAQAFYDVGSVSKYDVTTAEVEESKAELEVAKAQTVIKTAITTLNNAMGLSNAPTYTLEDIEEEASLALSLNDVQTMALKRRPDLLASDSSLLAAQKNLKLTAKENSPEIKASGKYSFGGERFSGEEDWSVGVSLQFPILDGGLEAAKIEQAKSEIVISEAENEAIRLEIYKEVEQAYLEFTDSHHVLAVALQTVKQAEENLDIAQNRYKVGVGSPIEVADATEKYKEAKLGYWSALYSHRRALAALEKAVGGSWE
jgi:outer membrane protein